MSRSQWKLVSTITGMGGLLACFAFVFLPAVTTASRTPTGVSLLTTTAFQHAVAGEWAFLFEGLVALLTLVIAAWQVLRGPRRKVPEEVGRALLFFLFGSLTLVILFNFYRSPFLVSHSITRIATSSTISFTCDGGTVAGPFHPPTTDACTEAALSPSYEPGFWFSVVGMVLVVVGSLVQVVPLFPLLLTRFPKQAPAGQVLPEDSAQ